MNQLSDIGRVKALLEKYNFSFSKSYGQNFLINPSVCPRMAEIACGYSGNVIEIGPGIGVLTAELAKRAKSVVSIELDKRLEPILTDTLSDFDNVDILFDDAMSVDFSRIIDEKFPGESAVICANLPYNITSPMIMKILEKKEKILSAVLMIQKEVAERVCAKLGSRQAGAITASVNYYSQPEILFKVSRGSFMPAPKVDSAVINLKMRRNPAVQPKDEALFFRVIRASFGQRRKTALNSISSGLSMPKNLVSMALDESGIPQNSRGESMSLEQFKTLSDNLFAAKGRVGD